MKVQSNCNFKIGDKAMPRYNKRRKGEICQVVDIAKNKWVDITDNGKAYHYYTYECIVRFEDGIIERYKDCYLKKVSD